MRVKKGGGERTTRGYFLRLISNPGSALLMDTKPPCSSRVLWNRSPVVPTIFSRASLTMVSYQPTNPLVVELIILFLPSRMYSFLSMKPPCL
jgi:hypothetical protein